MGTSKLVKSPNFTVIFQITESAEADAGRSWEVHDVERRRGFNVTLPIEELQKTPKGRESHGEPWTDEQVEAAVLLALEKALESPPEKLPGETYDVNVTCVELYDALELPPAP